METVIIIILAISAGIQYSAAVYALLLIRVTGFKSAWVLISVSLFLMGNRRLLPLYQVLADPQYRGDMVNEITGLVLSVCMFAGVYGIGPILIERLKSEDKIKKLLSEKETLLRELYHRTKNSLQVVRSLILLQADKYPGSEDIRELVKTTENRIHAMSLVHQKLYTSNDLSSISMREYIEDLSLLILHSYKKNNDRIKLSLEIDDKYFLLDTAIPLGIILNELITNSIKYAFPSGAGEISISLKGADDGYAVLHYADSGIGLPDDFKLVEQESLGLSLVRSIVEKQIMGRIEMINRSGLNCLIEFKENIYNKRV